MHKQAAFQAYDQPPEPIGGFAAILQNLEYLPIAKLAGIQGKVVLNVLVNKNGGIDSVKVWQSLGNSGCDEAAIQAVKAVKWKPARQNQQPVAVWVGIPVVFKLDANTFVTADEAKSSDAYQTFFDKLSRHADYPALALQMNLEGKVILRVFVDRQGGVFEVKVEKGSGYAEVGFDEAAVDLVKNKKWPVVRQTDKQSKSYSQKIVIVYKKGGNVFVRPLSRRLDDN